MTGAAIDDAARSRDWNFRFAVGLRADGISPLSEVRTVSGRKYDRVSEVLGPDAFVQGELTLRPRRRIRVRRGMPPVIGLPVRTDVVAPAAVEGHTRSNAEEGQCRVGP